MSKSMLLDEKALRQLNAPILCQDEKWLEIMNADMTENLRAGIARQSALIEEDKAAGHHLVELKRQKRNTLSQLLGLSEGLQQNSEEAENLARRLKNLLERINDEIEQIQYKMETSPGEIRKINGEILEESIALGYDRLLKDHKRIRELEGKIQKLRNELLALNDEKFMLEDQASAMGQYLHSLLGKELSDELDARFMQGIEEMGR